MEFHETQRGRNFFEYQLPRLIEAINRLATAQESANFKKYQESINCFDSPIISGNLFEKLCNLGGGNQDKIPEEEILDVIDVTLTKAGYRVVDGDHHSVIIRNPKQDKDYEIKVTEFAG